MSHSVHVITHFVSPYQVELFNAVSAHPEVELFVSYLYDEWKGRHWKGISVEHPHCVLKDEFTHRNARQRVTDSDVVVFNTYRDRFPHRMIKLRAHHRSPWAFWGERPAFRWKGPVGTMYRRWRLAPLVRSRAPIWGIGTWATAKYRVDFGERRNYAELPYYSNLERFRRSDGQDELSGPRRFLFSGALTVRKGADLLADAFLQLVEEGQDVALTLVGTGDLDSTLRRKLHGLGDRVRFAGFQDWQTLPSWYHQAHVLVAPSRYDGWGLIVPEGLAAGLPVIGTDHMGAAIDLIEPGRNGWICRAGDLDSLSESLRRAALLTPEQLCEHRYAAEASVAEHQLTHGAARFITLCEQVIEHWHDN